MAQTTKTWDDKLTESEKDYYHSLSLEDRKDVFLTYLGHIFNKKYSRYKGFVVKHVFSGIMLTKVYPTKGGASRALTDLISTQNWYFKKGVQGSYGYDWKSLVLEMADSEWNKELQRLGVVEIVEVK